MGDAHRHALHVVADGDTLVAVAGEVATVVVQELHLPVAIPSVAVVEGILHVWPFYGIVYRCQLVAVVGEGQVVHEAVAAVVQQARPLQGGDVAHAVVHQLLVEVVEASHMGKDQVPRGDLL